MDAFSKYYVRTTQKEWKNVSHYWEYDLVDIQLSNHKLYHDNLIECHDSHPCIRISSATLRY